MSTTGATRSTLISAAFNALPERAAGLLVSIKNPSEAVVALAGGADVIDVKEPAAGPLGAASLAVLSEVVHAVGGRAPVTAAMGELRDGFPADRLPPGIAVAKVGLAGEANRDWRGETRRLRSQLRGSTSLALVAYADCHEAEAPEPAAVLEHAAEIGCRWAVIDTWVKDGRCSLDLLGPDERRRRIQDAEGRGLAIVLAGAITPDRIEEAASCGSALIGVRGAACVGGRSGGVRLERVGLLAGRLAACRDARGGAPCGNAPRP